MIPILFDQKETDFTSNGIGRLSDAVSCKVTEERNGKFELKMEYPVTGAHFGDIKYSAIIVAVPAQGRKQQAFRIYDVSKELNGRVKVYAEHISYQLSCVPLIPFTAGSLKQTMESLNKMAAEPCPFTFKADFDANSSFAMPAPSSIRSYLGGRRGSILDIYGGEYEWDNYAVTLHKARGADRGVSIAYGKNLTQLQQEENIANTYTGIYPYYKGSDEDNAQMITLPEKVLQSENAGKFPYHRTVVKDFSSEFESLPTVDQLRNYTKQYMKANRIGVPAVNLKVGFINLADTEEYKDIIQLEQVSLCDTVSIRFAKLGVDTKAKVITTTWDVLKDRYVSIELGDARSTLADTVEQQIGQAVAVLPTINQVQGKIDRATGVLNAGLGGHVIINRNEQGWANEILFMDSANAALAHNVLRINQHGLGFSTTGYGGPYRNAWTIDGELDADFIRSGSIVLGGKTYNQTGEIIVKDGSGRVVCRMWQDGVIISSGKIQSPSIEGGSISIGENFKVDSSGVLTANNGLYKGSIEGSEIKGGRIEGAEIEAGTGLFHADDEEVRLGPFFTFSTIEGDYIALKEQEAGLGSNRDFHFWTGWSGGYPNVQDPEDVLHAYGTVITKDHMYAQEMYLSDPIFEGRKGWWGVGESIADIYSRIRRLEEAEGNGEVE